MLNRVLAAAAVLTLGLAGPSHAGYLVGAELFIGNTDGSSVNTRLQWDTNTNSAASYLRVDGLGKGIALLLSPGTTTFTFMSQPNYSLTAPGTFGSFGELGLFFDTTAAPYNPSATARTPDLVVAVQNGSTAFFVPIAGTSVNDYIYGAGSDAANGLSTFALGAEGLSFSSFTASNSGGGIGGSFSIMDGPANGSPIPEPGSLLLFAAGVAALALRHCIRGGPSTVHRRFPPRPAHSHAAA